MSFEFIATIQCVREPDPDEETWFDDLGSCDPPEEFRCSPLLVTFRLQITTGADCCSPTPNIVVEVTE
jgi:hypothetical protein